jgi:hypothetical protein
MAESTDRIIEFFDRWETLPSARTDCPPDFELVLLANDPAKPQWGEHLASCDHCKVIVDLLKQPSDQTGKNLSAFLAVTRQRAKMAAPDRRSSWLGFVSAFFRTSKPAVVSVVLGVIILITAGIWEWKFRARIPQSSDRTGPVSFDEDTFANALRLLQTTIPDLRTSTISSEETKDRIERINREMNKINVSIANGALRPRQRATISELFAEYQSALDLYLYAKSKPTLRLGNLVTEPQIVRPPDSDVIDKMYVSVDQALSGRSLELDKAPMRDIKLAAAVESGSRQVELVGFVGDQLDIKDRQPSRSDKDRDALDRAMTTFAVTAKVTVNFDYGRGNTKTYQPERPKPTPAVAHSSP